MTTCKRKIVCRATILQPTPSPTNKRKKTQLYGSPLHTQPKRRQVMRPTPLLHGIAAPSPSVLNFLRAQVKIAFESPASQCTALRRQQRGYGTRSLAGRCAPLGKQPVRTLSGKTAFGRTFATSQCLSVRKPQRIALEKTVFTTYASKNTTQSRATISSRSFSTSPSHHGWNLFKSAKMRRLAQLSPPPSAPDENSSYAAGFGSSLGRIMRPANELKMRCTELDEHGNVTLVSGEFKKSELIAKVCCL